MNYRKKYIYVFLKAIIYIKEKKPIEAMLTHSLCQYIIAS